MATLTIPRSDVSDLVTQVMAEYHADLDNAGVTVGLLAQWPSEGETDADDPGGSCLKLHGYPCAAVVKITPYRQRVQGVADAVITLDGGTWKGLARAEKVALIDHELTHLELARDEDGHVKTDDAGRPKLKMRLHDVQAGWFVDIARRHGAASFEVKQARETYEAYRQQFFEFDDDDEDEPGKPFKGLSVDGVPVETEGELRAVLRETLTSRAAAGAAR